MQPKRLLISMLIALVPLVASGRERAPGGTAFIKSLFIPGWGQYTLGQKSSALAFLGTDLVFIGGILTLNSYGRSARDDYRALAAVHAGVSGSHGHDYYVDVGNWINVDLYNERRLRERNYDALYTSASDLWAWDTDAHRAEMEKIRIKSDRAFNSVIYFVGGIVLNHVASAIHAGRFAASQREGMSEQSDRGWGFAFQPDASSKGLHVRFTYDF